MVLDLIKITKLMKEYNLCSNYVVLSNGTCVSISSPVNLELIVTDVDKLLSTFEPGGIDFHCKKLNNDVNVITYDTPNIYNFVNINRIKNSKNRNSTFSSILGRNQLLRDLSSPKVYAVVSNNEILDDMNDYRLPRYREI